MLVPASSTVMGETKNINDHYEILKRIGRGSYASVYKAIDKKTLELCAIKRISDSSNIKDLINEIHIMDKSKNDYMVRKIDQYIEEQDRGVSIVMEYCCGGSVKDVMRELRRTITKEQIIVIVRDVLKCLQLLHSKDIIHRDVKAANILLNEDGIAKLGDFGVSEPLDKNKKSSKIIGTPLWLPPEVINTDTRLSTAVDIWSLGITIIEMADRDPPYHDRDTGVALSLIVNPKNPPPTFSKHKEWPDLAEFLTYCLVKDPTKRKSAGDLLNCDIIKNAPSKNVIKGLVDEVCAKTNRSAELESSLCKQFECSLNEVSRLYSQYKRSKLEIIRVDQMTDRLRSSRDIYEDLTDRLSRGNRRIIDVRNQLEVYGDENQKLERELNDLKASLDRLRSRKDEIHSQVDAVKVKII